MASPPVHPSASTTSGTGSVRTMWLEENVSRSRSGRSGPLAPPGAQAPPRPRPQRPPPAADRQDRRARAHATDVCRGDRVLEPAHARTLVDADAAGEQAL